MTSLKRKRKEAKEVLLRLAAVLFAAAALYAMAMLVIIFRNYRQIGELYGGMEARYAQKEAADPERKRPFDSVEDEEISMRQAWEDDSYYEDAEVPVRIDWGGLLSESGSIVGWIYADSLGISYPVAQGEDNEYYLHHTPGGDYLFAGTIFLSCGNSPDFSDANSIVYGHNMKNGSMFGNNGRLKDQAAYDEDPYFWILTPEGNYRYHIYSVTVARPETEPYMLWKEGGPEFLVWEKALQRQSLVKNDVELRETDHTVILSCCEADPDKRTLVIGRCCSPAQPPEYGRQASHNSWAGF